MLQRSLDTHCDRGQPSSYMFDRVWLRTICVGPLFLSDISCLGISENDCLIVSTSEAALPLVSLVYMPCFKDILQHIPLDRLAVRLLRCDVLLRTEFRVLDSLPLATLERLPTVVQIVPVRWTSDHVYNAIYRV